jgi:hypothetical protein
MNGASQCFGSNLDTNALIALSSQGPGQITSTDQVNMNYRGLILGINLTTMTNASVVVAVRGRDAVSGQYYTLFQTPQALTAVEFQQLTVYPGTFGVNQASASPLPATWGVLVTISGTGAIVSGTIGASLLQ